MADYSRIFYPESNFGGFTDIDGTVVFYTRVNALLTPVSVALDVGCGRAAFVEDDKPTLRNLRTLKGKCAKVLGIDVDPIGVGNPVIDEFRLIQGSTWPVEDVSVDLVVSDNVLEHLDRPDVFFSEIDRVLKPGGHVCIRTPNVWSYVCLFSRLIPHRYHVAVVAKVQDGRKEEDVFPTLYRCNSPWRIRKVFNRLGYDHAVYGYEAEPSYLSFSRIAYWFGVQHQRYAPRFLRPAIFAFARKPLSTPAAPLERNA